MNLLIILFLSIAISIISIYFYRGKIDKNSGKTVLKIGIIIFVGICLLDLLFLKVREKFLESKKKVRFQKELPKSFKNNLESGGGLRIGIRYNYSHPVKITEVETSNMDKFIKNKNKIFSEQKEKLPSIIPKKYPFV